MIAGHSTLKDFFINFTARFFVFLLLTGGTMPGRRSLGQALGRVSIFLCENYRNGASKNESHKHIKISIILIIYHFKKMIMPLKNKPV